MKTTEIISFCLPLGEEDHLQNIPNKKHQFDIHIILFQIAVFFQIPCWSSTFQE